MQALMADLLEHTKQGGPSSEVMLAGVLYKESI